MGGAMLRSWLDKGLAYKVDVIDPSPLSDDLSENSAIHYNASFDNKTINSDVLVLAVKPQTLLEASQGIINKIDTNTVILSIAAGQSLDVLESIFGKERPIIRTMPNLPASIGEGMCVGIGNQKVIQQHRDLAALLLEACGQYEWTDDEALMDAVTALIGNGPAYVFYMIEALTKAATHLGLDGEFSSKLARQTVIGSAQLAKNENEVPVEILRKNVTSPGGTTEAALKVLMDGRFQDILNETLQAGKERSIALNK